VDNYEDKSDDEINRAVQHMKQGAQLWVPLMDYCGNASHSWPIIEQHGISLDAPLPNINKMWMARQDGWHRRYEDENPLRAAMIVFLKMQEAT